MNEREQLLARIKTAKDGANAAQNQSEKLLWIRLHNKYTFQLNRLKSAQSSAREKLKVGDRK